MSPFNFRGIGSKFSFLFHFSMKFMSANRIALGGTPRFAASHLELFCLHISHKKDAMQHIVSVESSSLLLHSYLI